MKEIIELTQVPEQGTLITKLQKEFPFCKIEKYDSIYAYPVSQNKVYRKVQERFTRLISNLRTCRPRPANSRLKNMFLQILQEQLPKPGSENNNDLLLIAEKNYLIMIASNADKSEVAVIGKGTSGLLKIFILEIFIFVILALAILGISIGFSYAVASGDNDIGLFNILLIVAGGIIVILAHTRFTNIKEKERRQLYKWVQTVADCIENIPTT